MYLLLTPCSLAFSQDLSCLATPMWISPVTSHLLQTQHVNYLWTGQASRSFCTILGPEFTGFIHSISNRQTLCSNGFASLRQKFNHQQSPIKNASVTLFYLCAVFSVVFNVLGFTGTALQRQQISMSYSWVSWENKLYNLHTQVIGHSSSHE